MLRPLLRPSEATSFTTAAPERARLPAGEDSGVVLGVSSSNNRGGRGRWRGERMGVGALEAVERLVPDDWR